MRQKTQNRGEIVYASNADDFNEILNTRLQELEDEGNTTSFEFIQQPGGFAAFIKTTKRIDIPETIAEEFNLRGTYATCADCPFYVKSTDGRVKYTECETGQVTQANRCACDIYYQILRTGKKMPERRNVQI